MTCLHCYDILKPLSINARIYSCQNRDCHHIYQVDEQGEVIVDSPITISGGRDENQIIVNFHDPHTFL